MNKHIKYWLAYNLIPSAHQQSVQAIIDHCNGELNRLFFESDGWIWRLPATPSFKKYLLANRKQLLTLAEKELKKCEVLGVTPITYTDDHYPSRLRQIHAPPPLLYVKGSIPELSYAVGVVGPRRPSPYGCEAAALLTCGLVENGIVVVSGLARGIDSIAHSKSIKNDGKTIAVIGTGLDVCYPWQNRSLCEEISEQGAVVTEFPFGSPPLKEHFPRRNRIISGLSLGVLVIEAKKRSGALITARLALEQGRDVFCVPGSIFNKNAEGTNLLIQQGAKLILTVEDVCEEIGLSFSKVPLTDSSHIVQSLKVEEQMVLNIIDNKRSFSEILDESSLNASVLSNLLVQLEINGHLKQVKHYYMRVR